MTKAHQLLFAVRRLKINNIVKKLIGKNVLVIQLVCINVFSMTTKLFKSLILFDKKNSLKRSLNFTLPNSVFEDFKNVFTLLKHCI